MTGNMSGRLLSNRYIITERIGLGGMAEVYQGRDNVLGRSVAVKIMLPQYAEDASFTARFRQEAASAANLSSPYIVNVYDWGQDNGTYYIVMEYVRGSDLKTAITQRGAINQRKVAEIGSQVCQALSTAHNMDIIHRDIKPQNIMIQPDGNVKVMDFGIARAKNSVMGKTESVLGTAHYISPEQAQGKDLTATSDIYSLGVVLYEASTGKLPFDGPDAVSVAMKQVNEMPVPPRQINPNLDPALEAIILKAMNKDPSQRFLTANSMRRALNDFLAGRPVKFDGFSSAETAVMSSNIPNISNIESSKDGMTAVMPASYGDSNQQKRTRNVYSNENQISTRRSGTGKRIAGVLVAILAVCAIGFGAWWFFIGSTPAGVEVPDVVGKTVDVASSEIEAQGLAVDELKYEYSSKVDAGLVISQSPKANTKQDPKTKVSLVVSQGEEQISVPDITNKTATEARSILQQAGLTYEAGTAEHSEDVAENRIARQEPLAGTMLTKGGKVTYFLSAGPEGTTIPNVVGELEGAARSKLSNAGFNVEIDYQKSSEVPEGAVISQEPVAGEKAKSGSSVSIVVSEGSLTYAVSSYATPAEGGAISPGFANVSDGGAATFYIAPAAGYQVSSISDSNGQVYPASAGSVTVSDVHGDIWLTVVFEAVGGTQGGGTSNEGASGSSSAASTNASNAGATTNGN